MGTIDATHGAFHVPADRRLRIWIRPSIAIGAGIAIAALIGMAWLEVGGAPDQVEHWLGSNATIPVQAVDSDRNGLLRVAVATPGREIVIT